jgi:hypothetical protein
MRRSRILTAFIGLAILLAAPIGVTAVAPTASPSRSAAENSQQQDSSPAWVIWETDTPVQRLALDGDSLWVGHIQDVLVAEIRQNWSSLKFIASFYRFLTFWM